MTASSAIAPDQLRREMAGIDWWHQIDLGHGIVTPGRGGDTRELIGRIKMPENLAGMSVLDIGAWDGAYSFEAERRGAARLVAVNEKPKPGLELARRVLGSRVESVQADMMELTPEAVGGLFDLVLFLGVVYHLPNPLAGLARVYDLVAPGGMMIMETDTRLNFLDHPAAQLVEDPRGLSNYDRNWWRPNWRAAVSMCLQVGFMRAQVAFAPGNDGPGVATRALRRFAPRFAPPDRTLRCVVHAWKAHAGAAYGPDAGCGRLGG